MTFSLLVHDPAAGLWGGAAATGNLCVGGWVLRGDSRGAISASQGALPSVPWGEDVLDAMRGGLPAGAALARVVAADPGRDDRQLAALDGAGRGAVHTGVANVPAHGARLGEGLVASGNMLASEAVLDALVAGYAGAGGAMAERLLAALAAAAAAGGDARGLISAALLVVGPGVPPLDLRIDLSERPLAGLERLLAATRAPDYAAWLERVPVRGKGPRTRG